jgi:8-hydroxy-5-deazaflavin:NADPH oxidoreductase
MSTHPEIGTKTTPVIGIIGAGKSGTAIARLALAAGYPVRIAASRPAGETATMTDIVAPARSPATSSRSWAVPTS